MAGFLCFRPFLHTLKSMTMAKILPTWTCMHRRSGSRLSMATILAILSGLTVMLTMGIESQAMAQSEIRCMRIEAFTRPDSEQSDKAVAFLKDLSARRPGIHVQIHDVAADLEARKRLYDLAARSGQKVALPAVYSGGQLLIGFQDRATTGAQIEGTLIIEAFVREGCPRCAEAKPYLYGVQARYPGLSVQIRELSQDPYARSRMEQLTGYYRMQPGIPTIHVGGRLIVGWNGFNITGSEIETLLHAVSEPCQGHGAAVAPPAIPAGTSSPSSWRGGNLWEREAILGLLVSSIQIPTLDEQSDAPTPVLPLDADDRLPMALPPEADLPPEAEDTTPGILPPPPPLPPAAERLVPFDTNWGGVAATPPPPLLEGGESLAPVAPVAAGAGQAPPPDEVRVPILGELNVRRLGLPAFTFLIGLVDGFNPCAMWVLVFLLTVLVSLNDRRKLILVAGTFVAISGLAYFAFMAAWLNVFMLIGFARWAQVGLGVLAVTIGLINVKDFFAFKQGISLSIPESAKPKIYERVRRIVTAKNLTGALIGAMTLAVLVNTVELLCTAGLPAVYTQILSYQGFPAWKNYAYLALYISAYMLDDTALLTVIVVTLSRRRLQEKEGRYLKLLSGVTILALGVVMLAKPEWLA